MVRRLAQLLALLALFGTIGACMVEGHGPGPGAEEVAETSSPLVTSVCCIDDRCDDGITADRCNGVHTACDHENCRISYGGRTELVSLAALEAYRLAVIADVAANGVPDRFDPFGFLDPLCSFFEDTSLPCPDTGGISSGAGAGSSGSGSSGSSGGHGPDWDCLGCVGKQLGCFVKCSLWWYPTCHAFCIDNFIDCTEDKCET
jgi:hypothetical protein